MLTLEGCRYSGISRAPRRAGERCKSDAPTPKKKNPGKRGNASGAGAGNSKPDAKKLSWNSGLAQRQRALQRMRKGPVTTCELQRQHDIYDPPARICELRKQGFKIDTVWSRDETESGVTHRVGQYVLVKEAA